VSEQKQKVSIRYDVAVSIADGRFVCGGLESLYNGVEKVMATEGITTLALAFLGDRAKATVLASIPELAESRVIDAVTAAVAEFKAGTPITDAMDSHVLPLMSAEFVEVTPFSGDPHAGYGQWLEKTIGDKEVIPVVAE